jgi:hypothetical protein
MSIRLRKKKATKINVCFVGPDYTIVSEADVPAQLA